MFGLEIEELRYPQRYLIDNGYVAALPEKDT